MSSSSTASPVKHISSIYEKACTDGTRDSLTLKQVRNSLESDYGWTCTTDEWKGTWKPLVQEEWTRVMSQKEAQDADEAVEFGKKQRRKSKYELAAEKNVRTLMGAFLDDLQGDVEDVREVDDDESVADDDEDEQNGSQSNASARSSDKSTLDKRDKGKGKVVAKAQTTKGKRKPKSAKTSDYKSKDTISDSDDDGDVDENGHASTSKSKKAVRDNLDEENDQPKRKRKKTAAKERAPPKAKEGDAPRGTEQEEARVQKLKALLSAAGVERPFTAATGAERKLTVPARFDRLEGLLEEAGLYKKGSGAKLPSLDKAKEVGQARALEKEMKELQGTPGKSGLRGGKHRSPEVEPKANKPKFGAFLSAFGQGDSDSD